MYDGEDKTAVLIRIDAFKRNIHWWCKGCMYREVVKEKKRGEYGSLFQNELEGIKEK